MTQTIDFKPYQSEDFSACMALFDDNCPSHFAPNEKADYQAYLEQLPEDYYIAYQGKKPLAAFGFLLNHTSKRGQITWIMVAKSTQGTGIGRQMMDKSRQLGLAADMEIVDIAASHLSAPFFARFGAKALNHIADGWGPGMHRIDMELVLSS